MDNQPQKSSLFASLLKFPAWRFTAKIWRYARWFLAAAIFLFIGLMIYRVPAVMEQKKTQEQIATIRATKLTPDDVMGVNLPPAPDSALVDATIEGIDANQNGIRDDVELAIFAAYPDSARIRAALLQYALALQMGLTQSIVKQETVIAVAKIGDKAYACVGKLALRDGIDIDTHFKEARRLRGFVEVRQLNTPQRKRAQVDFYEGNLGSYASPNEDCDLNI